MGIRYPHRHRPTSAHSSTDASALISISHRTPPTNSKSAASSCCPAQELHVDVQRDSADWPLVGFILMVDEFRPDNGATRFVPGSHLWPGTPEDVMPDRRAVHDGQLLPCGPAGSLLIFNRSAWHGHTTNTSDMPRRSLQGAFIPRDGRAWWASRRASRRPITPPRRRPASASPSRSGPPLSKTPAASSPGTCRRAAAL